MSIDATDVPNPITGNARLIITVTATVGLALTFVFSTVWSLEPAYQNRALHVAKETAAAAVLLFVAAVLFGRFRRGGRLLDLLALAGVVILAGKNLVFSVLGAILTETSGGLTTWRTTGAGMLGAALLVASALAPDRMVKQRGRSAMLTAGACLAALGILIVIADIFELPAAFSEDDPPETTSELRLLSQNAELLVADIGAAVLFMLAGAAFAWRAERERDEFQLWLGIGSVIAAMAYLNYTLFPSAYTDFLYLGDIFRIAAVLAWGIGTVREIARYQSGYARAAVLEERRRVARDIHDGVAQELAFISSHMDELKAATARTDLADVMMESVQRALDETRGAISALGRPVHEPFHLALASTAEEITSRLGAELELDMDKAVAVPPAWEEALPRILREAVANAVRHGRARTITVRLRDVDRIWMRVTDDGKGFDLTDPASGFGLIGMKERTESLGGEFKLESQPGHGTSVEVRLP
jgi:signal transduction histidine kinase